jgi:hypothetical protein
MKADPRSIRQVEQKPRRALNKAALLLLLSFLLLLCQLVNMWVFNAKASAPGSLPVSIQAGSQADYSGDRNVFSIPPINDKILEQIIMDMPSTYSPEDRMATLEVVLSLPVPTMTPNYPTPALTQTIVPTPSRIPTQTTAPTIWKTQTPTPVFTSTKSPTSTSFSLATAMPIPAKPDTSTPTPTPTPTATETSPTDTPTPTPTNTPTPTPTNTPVCMLTSSGMSIGGQQINLSITNNGGAVVTIVGININWIDTPESQMVKEVKFNGVTIINSSDPLPPSDYPSERIWTGTESDRALADADPKLLELLFEESLQPSGYSITITFDNGCTMTESN